MKRVFQKLDLRINDKFRVDRTDMLLPNGDRIVTNVLEPDACGDSSVHVRIQAAARHGSHYAAWRMMEEGASRKNLKGVKICAKNSSASVSNSL